MAGKSEAPDETHCAEYARLDTEHDRLVRPDGTGRARFKTVQTLESGRPERGPPRAPTTRHGLRLEPLVSHEGVGSMNQYPRRHSLGELGVLALAVLAVTLLLALVLPLPAPGPSGRDQPLRAPAGLAA